MHIAVTGHRPDKLNREWNGGIISSRLKKKFIEILKRNPDAIGIEGGALGIDTIFAQACIELNRRYIVAIPFEGQERKWSPKDQETYNFIRHHRLARVEIISDYIPKTGFGLDFGTIKLYQVRNEWMVDRCDGLVSAWDGTEGGTLNCTRYALQEKKPIIHIHPRDPKLIERKLDITIFNSLLT